MANTCRICLKSDIKDLLSLYLYNEAFKKTYFQMYKYVSGAEPRTNSKFICSICAEELKTAFLFKEKIQTNEKMFNELIGNILDGMKEINNDDSNNEDLIIVEPTLEIDSLVYASTASDTKQDFDFEKVEVIQEAPIQTWYNEDKSNEDEVIQCVLCSYNTLKKCNFQKHVERVHKRAKMRCDGCNASFHLIYMLEKHRVAEHGFFHEYVVDESLIQLEPVEVNSDKLPLIECPLCDYKSTSKDNYGKHVKRTHNRESLQCDGCEESFHLVHVLDQHRRVKHGYSHRYEVVKKSSSLKRNAKRRKS